MEASKEDIIRIAETAIKNIIQLTNIVGRSSPPSGSLNNAGCLYSTNAVQELHRRFSTVDPRGRNTARGAPEYRRSTSAPSARAAPYSWRAPGQPSESPSLTKDVVVIEYGHDQVTIKAEKAEIQTSCLRI